MAPDIQLGPFFFFGGLMEDKRISYMKNKIKLYDNEFVRVSFASDEEKIKIVKALTLEKFNCPEEWINNRINILNDLIDKIEWENTIMELNHEKC
jgi:hypothetical protein